MQTRKNERQSPKAVSGQIVAIQTYFDTEYHQEQKERCNGRKRVYISMSNVYVQTVLKLFNRYLIEEATGQGITADIRLDSLLKQARELHRIERQAMVYEHCFGNNDETNTELIFTD